MSSQFIINWLMSEKSKEFLAELIAYKTGVFRQALKSESDRGCALFAALLRCKSVRYA